MRTSVFKDILDRSISGDKIYNGTIDWVDGITTQNLIVKSSGGYDGTGSIDGASFSIGSFVPIGSINCSDIYTGTIFVRDVELDEGGDVSFSGGSLDSFYSNYLNTKSIVDSMVSNGINSISSHIVQQLNKMTTPSTVTLSNDQWIRMSTMQNVATTSSPTFLAIACSTLTASSAIKGNSLAINETSYGINSTGNATLNNTVFLGTLRNNASTGSIDSSGNIVCNSINLNSTITMTSSGVITTPGNISSSSGNISSGGYVEAKEGINYYLNTYAYSPTINVSSDLSGKITGLSTGNSVTVNGTKFNQDLPGTDYMVLLTPLSTSGHATLKTVHLTALTDNSFTFSVGQGPCDVFWFVVKKIP